METRTVFIVDDHPLLRNGLRQALELQHGFVLTGEADSGKAAVSRVAELKPDLIVMDVHLPDMTGIEATRQIVEALPVAKVLILSGDVNRSLVDAALQAGASGYLLKKSVVEELNQAIEAVLAGKLYLSSEVSDTILDDYRKSLFGEAQPSKRVLSEREKELVRLIAEGRRSKEIATELGASTKAIETQRARLMKKIGCSTMAEVVRYAIREGIAGV